MKKILLLLIPLLLLSACKPTSTVCQGETCFKVEIAESPEERVRGLMFRESLDDSSGMLFIFEQEDQHNFWMKNTFIPLDIIWLNSDYEIIYINHNTPPCTEEPCPTFGPEQKSSYVLELNAGVAKGIGLEIGEKLEIYR